MNKHLKAIRKKLEGERDEHLADLDVYLTNLVGVGEHPDFGEVIEKKIKREFPLGKVAERTIGYERIDENGNEVWGLKCSEDTVIKLHEDLEESFIFSQLCQILPQKLLEEGGLQSLKDSASDLIAKRDDPEVTITMADIAAIGDGVFVDFDDEDSI